LEWTVFMSFFVLPLLTIKHHYVNRTGIVSKLLYVMFQCVLFILPVLESSASRISRPYFSFTEVSYNFPCSAASIML
jgi:hypothetical protein